MYQISSTRRYLSVSRNGIEVQRFYPPLRIYPVLINDCGACRIKLLAKDNEIILDFKDVSSVNDVVMPNCLSFLTELDSIASYLISDESGNTEDTPQIEVNTEWVQDDIGQVLWMEAIYNEITESTVYRFYNYPNGLRIIPTYPVYPLTAGLASRQWLGDEIVDLTGTQIKTLSLPATANLAEIYVQDISVDSVMFRINSDPTPQTAIIQDRGMQFELENRGEIQGFRASSLNGNLVRILVNYYNVQEGNT